MASEASACLSSLQPMRRAPGRIDGSPACKGKHRKLRPLVLVVSTQQMRLMPSMEVRRREGR